jgi:hypothetical protein
MARLRRTVAAVTAAAPVLVATAGSALAGQNAHGAGTPTPDVLPPPGGHYVTWQNQHNAEYLHVKDGSKSNSAVINTYTGSGSCEYHGETDLQCPEEWSQVSTAYAHEFGFVNINSGLCLDDGENAFTTPTQYSCGTFAENKRWTYGTEVAGGGATAFDTLATAYAEGPGDERIMCTKGGEPSLYIYNSVTSTQNIAHECSWH